VGADFKTEGQRIAAYEFIGTIRRGGFVELPGAVVADGSEQGAFGVGGVAGFIQAVVEEFLCAINLDIALEGSEFPNLLAI
jgi:hypothetical protein